MSVTPNSRVSLALEAAAWLLLAWVLAFALLFHGRICFFPYELMPGEFAVPYSAWLLDHGRNPYDFVEHPAAMNVYGWVMPVLVHVVGVATPSALLVATRCVNGVGLLGSALGLAWAGRRMGADRLLCAGAGICFYLSQLVYVGPMARVDGLGLGLLMASVLVAWATNFSFGGLAVAAVLAGLGFYTKLYIALALPLVVLGLGLRRGWARAGLYACLVLAALAASVPVVCMVFPTYFYDTVAVQLAIQTHWWGYMARQLAMLGTWHLALALTVIATAWWRPAPPQDRDSVLWAACFGLGLALFGLVFGPNSGAFLTYGLHLVLPFAWLWALSLWRRRPWPRVWLVAGLSLQALVLLQRCPDWRLMASLGERRADMQTGAAVAARLPSVWFPSEFDSVLLQAGRPIHDAGHAEGMARMPQLPAWAAPWFPRMDELNRRWRDQVEQHHAALARSDYAMVVRTVDAYDGNESLAAPYRRVGTLVMRLPAGMGRTSDYGIWVPR